MTGCKRVYLLVASQELYGPAVLGNVDVHAKEVAAHLTGHLPVDIVYESVLTSPAAIAAACSKADNDPDCVGVICWAHTFSPAMMWIPALRVLKVPAMQLHTQYGTTIPPTIDMDYMNEHQTAHGGRELGHGFMIASKAREIVVGHWQDPDVISQIDNWVRAACGWQALQHLTIARIAGKMRDVAVTDGNPVTALRDLGFRVHDFGVGDLVERIPDCSDPAVTARMELYQERYTIAPAVLADEASMARIREAAAIEEGLGKMLEVTGCDALTTNFQTLHDVPQVPGIAAQELMYNGFGFGPEGDWKTSALVYALKVMGRAGDALPGGTSLMEHYTYQFGADDERGSVVLGAHMLEICPSITDEKPELVVAPLSIGAKNDPARLVFSARPGPAINASLVDVGGRFRLVVNEVMVTESPVLPQLPVARALWRPKPSLAVEAAAWMMAGGAHHTAFSQQVGVRHLRNLARMLGIELVVIDEQTDLVALEHDLMLTDAAYRILNH